MFIVVYFSGGRSSPYNFVKLMFPFCSSIVTSPLLESDELERVGWLRDESEDCGCLIQVLKSEKLQTVGG